MVYASNTPQAKHARVKGSVPNSTVAHTIPDMQTVAAIEIWVEPGLPGVCHRYHLEDGTVVAYHLPSKVAKPFFRELVRMMSQLDYEFRAAMVLKVRSMKRRLQRRCTFTPL